MIWLVIVALGLTACCALLWIQRQRVGQEQRDELERHAADNERLSDHAANYKQKLAALTESSGAGVLVLNGTGRVTEASATAGRILGTDVDELVGHALIQATLSNEMQEYVKKAANSGVPQTAEFELPGSQSKVMRVSVYNLPVPLSSSSETMVILVDVTELHRLETVRRDFVANVSHELRTPLASIRAIAETLQEGALEDEEVAISFLETIMRESDRLGRIAEDLLLLSDAESKPPQKAWFNLSDLLREVVSRSEKHAEMSRVDLSLKTEPVIRLFASRDQIEQVVVNLVDNAIKYSGEGGDVTIEARKESDTVTVTVSDTGIGIMQQDLPRIFERFYRVDKARSRQSGGTGLGLSIVRNIIEAHDGDVKVASEFNRGSAFTIAIPNPKETAS